MTGPEATGAWKSGRGVSPRRSRRDDPMTLVVLQEDIKQLILDRRLRPGDPLPTESELVEFLRVGRNSVREALKSLQALDIVEIRHGYGTFVGSMSLEPLADGLTFRIHVGMRDGLRELRALLEIRKELEASFVRKVTPLTGEEEVGRLRETLDAFAAAEAADDGAASRSADRLFHQLLYQPLGNRLVLQLLDTFWTVYQRLVARLPELPQARGLLQHHHAIVDALAACDAAAAEEAVHAHFDEIEERLAAISPRSADP